MLNKILTYIGYSQFWFINYFGHKNGVRIFQGDGVFNVKPRLTKATFKSLRIFIANDVSKIIGDEVLSKDIVIVSLTRIPK